jgi:hypothetical protein
MIGVSHVCQITFEQAFNIPLSYLRVHCSRPYPQFIEIFFMCSIGMSYLKKLLIGQKVFEVDFRVCVLLRLMYGNKPVTFHSTT